jgi:hypothetical protein
MPVCALVAGFSKRTQQETSCDARSRVAIAITFEHRDSRAPAADELMRGFVDSVCALVPPL